MSQPSNELLVDGYISRAFNPRSAEEYFSHLLKTNNWTELISSSPSGSGMVFLIRGASRPLRPPPFMVRNGVPLWLLDYNIEHTGTVVPQTLWAPYHRNDFKQHVEDADLQLPIFFIHGNGSLGLSLDDAANGRCRTLRDANAHSQLGGKTTTHIRISWPGYQDFKRQVQIRDETAAHNPITVARFAQHVGRSVDAFLGNPISKENPDPRWEIGRSGVNRANIRVIGAVHVSAGSWMPILQLNSYVI
ncbi:hypothetical protein EDB89DRAFT_1910744 [Lactarius sanguifluus]|nr:hypothetical protein EDB89DRAFT_1910744 [Lactarius sanguifluus]